MVVSFIINEMSYYALDLDLDASFNALIDKLIESGVSKDQIENDDLTSFEVDNCCFINPRMRTFDNCDTVYDAVELLKKHYDKYLEVSEQFSDYSIGKILSDMTCDIFDFEDRNFVFVENSDEDAQNEELARIVIDEIGGCSELPKEQLEYYFDYAAYGRDLVMSGNYAHIPDAYCFIN